jgi:hypothetical protein
MVQQNGRVVFSRSTLSNAGKKVPFLRNVTNLWMHSIVPSDSSALTNRANCITLHENCDQKFTGLVTV